MSDPEPMVVRDRTVPAEAGKVDYPDLDGFPSEHYGVQIGVIGEEGDRAVAFGHIEPRRALAALNRHVRNDLGWQDLFAESWRDDVDVTLAAFEYLWAVVLRNCKMHPGCGGPDLVADPVDLVKRPACYECAQIAADCWWLDWSADTTQDTPGAFPVTVLEM